MAVWAKKAAPYRVLHRYMRGINLRWPLSILVKGRGVDLINHAHKCCLLAAGHAIVSLDIRGTGMQAQDALVCFQDHLR